MKYFSVLFISLILFSCANSGNLVGPINNSGWKIYYSQDFSDTVSGSKTLDLGSLSLTLCDSVITHVLATYVKPDPNGGPQLLQIKSDTTKIMNINSGNFPSQDSLNNWALYDSVASPKAVQHFKLYYTDISPSDFIIVRRVDIWKKNY
jgi:hypothetical protein